MYEFCTYFDHRYLARAMVLVQSLRNTTSAFRLWALCLNDEARVALERLSLPEVTPIPLAVLEAAVPALGRAKTTRSPLEYYFTCSPFLPSFIFERHAEIGTLTYVDADLFFFADPAPLFREMGDAPIAIIGHRFPPRLSVLEVYGVYNVGWLSFRRGARAAECLGWWQQRCLEWCYDRIDQGRFADQKYLDDWPTRFPGTVELKHRGACVAPWNLESYPIGAAARGVEIGGQPLIFFHFHGVKHVTPRVFDLGFAPYGVRANGLVVRRIFAPYLRALGDAERTLTSLGVSMPAPHGRTVPRPPGGVVIAAREDGLATTRLQEAWRLGKAIVRRRFALVLGGFVP